jgi:hypothetical protein
MLLTGFERGVLRPPSAWFAKYGAQPRQASLPPASKAVRFRLGTLLLGADGLLVDGSAQLEGAGVPAPLVSLVLRSPERTYVIPTRAVPDLADLDEPGRRKPADTGFRSLVPRAALPAGRYRLGLLVARARGASLSYHAEWLVIPNRS